MSKLFDNEAWMGTYPEDAAKELAICHNEGGKLDRGGCCRLCGSAYAGRCGKWEAEFAKRDRK